MSLLYLPGPVEWHDGMLLTPKHFDELTARLERLIEHASVTSAPFNWGVFRLTLGEAELLDGAFDVAELEAILPDGMTVVHDAQLGGSLRLDLSALDGEFKTHPFVVYLTVPAHREGEDRLWRFQPAQATREEKFTAETEGSPSIPRMEPRLQLVASRTTPPSRLTSLPLARLQFRNGAFARLDDFIPPSRQITVESPLLETVVPLLRRIREVAVVLQQQYRSLSAQERQDQDFARRSAVQQLVAMLPYAEAVAEAGEAHPFTLYTTLCALAGHISSISTDPIPPNFPRYNHYDIVASFAPVSAYIGKVLAENSSTDFTGIPFQHGDGTFYLLFEPSWKGRNLLIGMRGENKVTPELIAWAEHALIGSSIVQDSMRERRILGARRARVEREQGLFVGPDVALFRIGNDDEFIQGGEMLEVSGIAGSRSGEPVEMVLYVMHS